MESAMTLVKVVYEIIARTFLTLPYGLYGVQIVQRMGKKNLWMIGFVLGSFVANLVIETIKRF